MAVSLNQKVVDKFFKRLRRQEAELEGLLARHRDLKANMRALDQNHFLHSPHIALSCPLTAG